jgi:ATP-binding cassette subfamily B protein
VSPAERKSFKRASAREADIVVMDQGRILEQGTHDEFLARRGAYHGLYTMSRRTGAAAD